MPYIEYENGHISRWDDKISVGQLISTYYSGYFILERIEYTEISHSVKIIASDTTDTQAPIFHFVKVLNEDGTKSRQCRKSCSAIYCKKITPTWAEFNYAADLAAAQFKRDALKEFLGSDVPYDRIESELHLRNKTG